MGVPDAAQLAIIGALSGNRQTLFPHTYSREQPKL